MNRLTEKDLQGNWCLKGVPWESLHAGQMITKELRQKIYGALWKLMEYEDTGLSPEEVEEVNKFEGSNGQKWLLEIAKHRWIPVSERLPEEGKEVLAQFTVRVRRMDNQVDKAVYIFPLNYREGIWRNYKNGMPNGKVEYWQPLPSPYKGER